jgi:glutamyl-Q tRNA(Asp) synthetase
MTESVGGTGRFAPSPTGPLHFGSLIAAVASYLDARHQGARWLLRIENIDPPREVPGAADSIVQLLDIYGFEWDGPVLWQADSRADHEAALARLIDSGTAYPCGCSRRDLAGQPTGPLGVIYPGTCRGGTDATECAWRVRTDNALTRFDDLIQGLRTHALESESGDFIVKRKDGLIAYQLAVVVDDYLNGVTRVVRGIDLIDSTFRQVWLQTLLDFPRPEYAHIPVAVHANGDKLSKLTGAPGLAPDQGSANLFKALLALGQQPPAELADARVQDIWTWARENWTLEPLLGKTTIGPDLELRGEER